MNEISVSSENYQAILRDAIAIKFLIYINGGNAAKGVCEEVLRLRHPSVDRSDAHTIMNTIERRGLDESSLLSKEWRYDTAVPTLIEYNEIGSVGRIKWYKGRPNFNE